MKPFHLEEIPSQKGKIAVVTGANSGLGLETTKGLAKKGFLVVMACRNAKKAETALSVIKKEIPEADLVISVIDTASLKSVRAFARDFRARYSKLDLLVNNAGIMIPPFSLTEDQFESQLGTNYLGHFLLTGLLIPLLDKTEGARIISLSSNAHKKGHIDFEDLNFKKRSYSRWEAYRQSKLACLMFAYELDRRLKQKGSKAISVVAHPGVSNTNLGQFIPFLLKPLTPLVGTFIGHPPENGAKPTLMAALYPDLKGGDYFGPGGKGEWKGPPVKVDGIPLSKNKSVAQRLWSVSEALTGINYLD